MFWKISSMVKVLEISNSESVMTDAFNDDKLNPFIVCPLTINHKAFLRHDVASCQSLLESLCYFYQIDNFFRQKFVCDTRDCDFSSFVILRMILCGSHEKVWLN